MTPQEITSFVAAQRYKLVWLENANGELSERTDYFVSCKDMIRFIDCMLVTGRLFEIVEFTGMD